MKPTDKRTGLTAQPAGRPRGRRALVWVAVAVVAALVVASYSGWLGYGWAHLKARVLPRDEGVLGFVPSSASAVVIIDPHLVDDKALGGPGGALRQALDHARQEIKKATSVDLVYDVDKIALVPGLFVARGRFDVPKLTDKLATNRYAPADYGGVRLLVRPGEDAVAMIDDAVLYGEEANVKAAIDARANGQTLDKDERVLERLKKAGWDHAVLLSVRLADDRPSLRTMLRGSGSAVAITAAITTRAATDVRIVVEENTPEAAQELAKVLDEKRQSAEALRTVDDAVVQAAADSAALADVAKGATVRTAGTTVEISSRVPSGAIDAVFPAALVRGGDILRAP